MPLIKTLFDNYSDIHNKQDMEWILNELSKDIKQIY